MHCRSFFSPSLFALLSEREATVSARQVLWCEKHISNKAASAVHKTTRALLLCSDPRDPPSRLRPWLKYFNEQRVSHKRVSSSKSSLWPFFVMQRRDWDLRSRRRRLERFTRDRDREICERRNWREATIPLDFPRFDFTYCIHTRARARNKMISFLQSYLQYSYNKTHIIVRATTMQFDTRRAQRFRSSRWIRTCNCSWTEQERHGLLKRAFCHNSARSLRNVSLSLSRMHRDARFSFGERISTDISDLCNVIK